MPKTTTGLKRSLTNLRNRTTVLVTYLEKNAHKFNTKARPEFRKQIKRVKNILPK